MVFFYGRVLGGLGIGLLLFFSSLACASPSWQLEKEADGVKVWVAPTPGSDYKQFKGQVVINAPLKGVQRVLEDVQNFPRWYHKMVESKVIKSLGNGHSLRYSVTDLPWPVSDRDAVVEAYKEVMSNGELRVIFVARPNAFPLQEDRIRMPRLQGRWVLTPLSQTQTQVTFQVAAEPGGSIPSWLANQMVVDVPFNTLRNLKLLIEGTAVENPEAEKSSGAGSVLGY